MDRYKEYGINPTGSEVVPHEYGDLVKLKDVEGDLKELYRLRVENREMKKLMGEMVIYEGNAGRNIWPMSINNRLTEFLV